jgi:pilus assembly protein Flp/PilA
VCPAGGGVQTWEKTMSKLVLRFVEDDSGATAIEYALIAALIGTGIIVVLQNVRGELQNTFTKVQTELKNATN